MREMKLQDLKVKTPAELVSFAEELEVENASTMRKQELMFGILKQLSMRETDIVGEGVDGPAVPRSRPMCTIIRHCANSPRASPGGERARLRRLPMPVPLPQACAPRHAQPGDDRHREHDGGQMPGNLTVTAPDSSPRWSPSYVGERGVCAPLMGPARRGRILMCDRLAGLLAGRAS